MRQKGQYVSEKEKMLLGQPYRAGDEALVRERYVAKEMLFDLNTLHPRETQQREDILKKLLRTLGKDSVIESPFRCDYGSNISIGDNFYANYNCTILDCAQVNIGNHVLFAPNVSLFTAGHPVHYELRNAGIEYAFPITIGDNVWIGGGVIVNPGITIGSNVVIGAGSIVTKDIPSNVVAVGNPCKVIRTITDDDKKYYFRDCAI